MTEYDGIYYDEELGEWVAVAMDGGEVYGTSRADCEMRLQDANRVWLAHLLRSSSLSQIDDSRDSAEMLGV